MPVEDQSGIVTRRNLGRAATLGGLFAGIGTMAFAAPAAERLQRAARAQLLDEGVELLGRARLLPPRRLPPRSPLDMIVAAIAQANDCIVVTDNEKDFAGVKIVNLLRAGNQPARWFVNNPLLSRTIMSRVSRRRSFRD